MIKLRKAILLFHTGLLLFSVPSSQVLNFQPKESTKLSLLPNANITTLNGEDSTSVAEDASTGTHHNGFVAALPFSQDFQSSSSSPKEIQINLPDGTSDRLVNVSSTKSLVQLPRWAGLSVVGTVAREIRRWDPAYALENASAFVKERRHTAAIQETNDEKDHGLIFFFYLFLSGNLVSVQSELKRENSSDTFPQKVRQKSFALNKIVFIDSVI